jgi:hypothetical protein
MASFGLLRTFTFLPPLTRRDQDKRRLIADNECRHFWRITFVKYTCTLTHLPNGQWLARHTGLKLGPVEVTAASRDEAQVKLQNELQYRVELCPCSGVSGETVSLQIKDE